MNPTRNINRHAAMAAKDGDCARRMMLLAQKDDYAEAIIRAGDDASMVQCYTNMIQTIDGHLERLDAGKQTSNTSFLSSSSASAMKSNVAGNAAKTPNDENFPPAQGNIGGNNASGFHASPVRRLSTMYLKESKVEEASPPPSSDTEPSGIFRGSYNAMLRSALKHFPLQVRSQAAGKMWTDVALSRLARCGGTSAPDWNVESEEEDAVYGHSIIEPNFHENFERAVQDTASGVFALASPRSLC